MLKRLTAACLLSFAGLGAAAQLPDSADMSAGGEFRRRIDRHTSTKAYRMLFVGTPLIVGGVVMQAYDSDFRRLRNGYSRSFRHDYDDWLQYAPAGAMVALKACGVRGRSSWGRMLVSDAFSAGLMAIGVNSLKYSCRVMRPDGSSRNSFPSGHTATAFMAATMLHKEYGHRSPWYSIGGYTVATVTGVTRQLNNRHWMSDIMVGAGIGILATELGYFLADLIFKEKGLNVTETYSVYDRCRRPSFLGFSLGFSTVPGSYTPYPGMHMQFLSGPAVSVQGAWFATPYWGFGGRMSCTNLRSQRRGAERQSGVCVDVRGTLFFPPLFDAVARGRQTARRVRDLQTVPHGFPQAGKTRRILLRNRAFDHLPRHAKPRRALLDRLRRRTSRGAFVARTASQAHLRHGGLRGILKRKGRTRRSALCVFFPVPYRNDFPCAARRSRPAVTPSFTAAGIATPE